MAQRPSPKAGVSRRNFICAAALPKRPSRLNSTAQQLWRAGALLLACVSILGAADVPRSHELVGFQGRVEVLRSGSNAWVPATTNVALFPGDSVRTGKESRAAIRSVNDSVIRLDQLSVIRFREPTSPRKRFLINLLKGAAYFFHRERPVETDFETPLVSGAIRGTEFNLAVADNGRTVLSLLDGEVELNNPQGQLTLRTGDEAVIEPGAAPKRTALIDAVNIIQWTLYYPAVLDLDELSLADVAPIAESLAAYRSGEIVQALERYPANRQPVTRERLFLAQLQLAVGQVATAQQILDSMVPDDAYGFHAALRTVIAAVKNQETAAVAITNSASVLLAGSYYAQSRGQLEEALRLAQSAVALSPKFGFAWARLAELEFSFGHRTEALRAVDEAVRLSPRNAQAQAVKGFLLAAERKFSRAEAQFDQAIAIDSAFGNAWLGRGLCRIREGNSDRGLDDLLVAASLEPNRALLRSYLGKAFTVTEKVISLSPWRGEGRGDDRAEHEFALAKRLDPNDPTAWLYSALLNQQRNRINEAIDDLEQSIELNNNRRLYRSRFLLDEDRAVRGANLASIYQDAGMEETSFREAVRAANADYANYSAHIFLANSYNQLRDPKQVNLRYETPWLSEFLLANLLAPPEAGVLSQTVSQQEYSRLFERNRFGIVSTTEYQSSGDWLEAAAQYGIYNNMAYAVDVVYRNQNGQRPNNDLEQLTASLQLKYQLTPSDSAYFQSVYYRAKGGDLRQYFDQSSAIPDLRTKEKQEPLLIGGWHHEWSPENHTLFLAARLQDTYRVNFTNSLRAINQEIDANGVPLTVDQASQSLDYRNKLEIYSAEVQHIWQHNDYKLIAGGRFQAGEFETHNQMGGCCLNFIPPTDATFTTDFERAAAYGYGHWQPIEPLLFIAGVSYDWLKFPENWQSPPVSGQESSTERVSPKAGIIWTPWRDTTLRAAYTRSLGGVSFDQSFQLEPSQIAGFTQTYRSLIPESVFGALSAQRFETYGVALDQKFPTRTYLGISAELLRSRSLQTVGSYAFVFPNAGFPTAVHERLRFTEKSLNITVNQLILNEFSVGAQYRLRHADLEDIFTDVSPTLPAFNGFITSQHPRATLHQLYLFTIFNHPSGFFSQFQSVWNAQSNSGYSAPLPGDDFWQFNAFVGYRLPRRHLEVSVGVLNLTDRDYRLNPLTLYAELPRERTAVVTLKLNF